MRKDRDTTSGQSETCERLPGNENGKVCKVAVLLNQGNHQDLLEAMLSDTARSAGLCLAAIVVLHTGASVRIQTGKNDHPMITQYPDDLLAISDLDAVITLGDPGDAKENGRGQLSAKIVSGDDGLMRRFLDTIARQHRTIERQQRQIALLQEKTDSYEQLFDNSVVGMFRTDIHDGTLIMGNRKLAEMYRYSSYHAFLGRHNSIRNYADPENRKKLLQQLAAYGKVDDFEVQIKRSDGSVFWACMSAQIFPEKGYLEGMIMDIDNRKRAEEENKRLTHRLLNAQEDERRRIARDLHDDLGQALSVLQFDMDRLRNAVRPLTKQQRAHCDKLVSDIEIIGDIVRRISSNLRPGMLDHLGLLPALESLIKGFQQRNADIQVHFQVMGYKKRLNNHIETILFRSAQEALNNIEKHAKASNAQVLLTFSYPDVIMVIRDNGRGFLQKPGSERPADPCNGIGLLGMRERLESVGGSLSVRSSPGNGTILRAKIITDKAGCKDVQN